VRPWYFSSQAKHSLKVESVIFFFFPFLGAALNIVEAHRRLRLRQLVLSLPPLQPFVRIRNVAAILTAPLWPSALLFDGSDDLRGEILGRSNFHLRIKSELPLNLLWVFGPKGFKRLKPVGRLRSGVWI
jgi:hypothetical protein